MVLVKAEMIGMKTHWVSMEILTDEEGREVLEAWQEDDITPEVSCIMSRIEEELYRKANKELEKLGIEISPTYDGIEQIDIKIV